MTSSTTSTDVYKIVSTVASLGTLASTIVVIFTVISATGAARKTIEQNVTAIEKLDRNIRDLDANTDSRIEKLTDLMMQVSASLAATGEAAAARERQLADLQIRIRDLERKP